MLAMLLATTSNQGHAQFFFLVAAIACGLALLLLLFEQGRRYAYFAPILIILLALSIGLYFHA